MSVAFSGLSSFDALSPLEDYSTLWFILISNSGLRSAGSSLHHISHGVRYWCRCRQRGPKFGVMFAHDYLFSGKKWGKNSGERERSRKTFWLVIRLLLLSDSLLAAAAPTSFSFFPIFVSHRNRLLLSDKNKRPIYIFQRNSILSSLEKNFLLLYFDLCKLLKNPYLYH